MLLFFLFKYVQAGIYVSISEGFSFNKSSFFETFSDGAIM